MLQLATNLKLPVEVVTQAIGILAKRRAGKSYTARRLVEQLAKARQQVVIADPKGDWWGIRSSADGKAPGLPVVILGGERGDVPLEVGGGEVVAKLVVEERVSVLLDLSLLRKYEVATFMTAFLETLYRLKAREVYRTPVMLVIDEADAIAPQSPMKGEERMLGAAEDIVRRGGQRGIGCTMITQRSAVLNKNVLTQIQLLIALRTIAPQDLKAINAWIDVHGSEEERKTLMASLPSLDIGEAWFWSPGWPTTAGIFTRAKVLPIETYDSGATPKPGEKRREPKTAADVDLDALKRQMAATIERAAAEDPKKLQARIAELEKLNKQLEQRSPATGKEKRVEVPVIPPKAIDRIEAARAAVEAAVERAVAQLQTGPIKSIEGLLQSVCVKLREHAFQSAAESYRGHNKSTVSPESRPVNDIFTPRRAEGAQAALHALTPKVKAPRDARPATIGDEPLSKAQTGILKAMYWLRQEEATPAKVGFYSGYTVGTSTFGNSLGRLRTLGLVQGWRITPAGESAIAAIAGEKPSGSELREWLRKKLSKAQNELLDALIAKHPARLTDEELSQATGYTVGTSTFGNSLGRLRSIEAAEGYARDGGTKAADVFFS